MKQRKLIKSRISHLFYNDIINKNETNENTSQKTKRMVKGMIRRLLAIQKAKAIKRKQERIEKLKKFIAFKPLKREEAIRRRLEKRTKIIKLIHFKRPVIRRKKGI